MISRATIELLPVYRRKKCATSLAGIRLMNDAVSVHLLYQSFIARLLKLLGKQRPRILVLLVKGIYGRRMAPTAGSARVGVSDFSHQHRFTLLHGERSVCAFTLQLGRSTCQTIPSDGALQTAKRVCTRASRMNQVVHYRPSGNAGHRIHLLLYPSSRRPACCIVTSSARRSSDCGTLSGS